MQIMDEIKARIVSGRYKPGERIPSVRDLAEEARVNPNTMQKALYEIEREGYVISLRTSGRFITDNEDIIRQLKKTSCNSVFSSFTEEMQKMNIPFGEALRLLEEYGKNNNLTERNAVSEKDAGNLNG